jgi:hypothetical protein
MANKFLVPPEEALQNASDEEMLNLAPPVVEPCPYLREKASGALYPFNEHMARRGDLVEAYFGEPAVVIKAPTSVELTLAEVASPKPPKPGARRGTHSAVGVNLHATRDGAE